MVSCTATPRTRDAYLKRLRRIEGQVRGIQRLVDEDTYCIDVLTQISAATRALQGVALGLMEDHLHHCVADAVAEGGDDGTRSCARPPRPSVVSSVPDPLAEPHPGGCAGSPPAPAGILSTVPDRWPDPWRSPVECGDPRSWAGTGTTTSDGREAGNAIDESGAQGVRHVGDGRRAVAVRDERRRRPGPRHPGPAAPPPADQRGLPADSGERPPRRLLRSASSTSGGSRRTARW